MEAPRLIDGRYRVERLLGQGSSARTYQCVDEQGRPFAVKELLVRGLDGWKPVELFEREAKVLAGLRHHGVPAIERFFEGENERAELALYLVQELIEGPSLRDLLAAGPMDQAEVIRVALGVLDVLEYLHGRVPPVFHRDVKPANIVLRASGAPVLVDFGGVCHGWRPSNEGGSTVVGTFGYMPGEQLLGQVGPTSDLYALGATLLHLVTGRPPSDHSFDSGRLAVPAELDVRPELRRAIDGLLAPAPRDRPPHARAARELFLGTAATALVTTAPSRALARRRIVVGPKAPRPVDLGPPPRDPRGLHARVFRRLIEPLSDDVESVAGSVFGWTMFVLGTAATAGLLPALYYAGHVRGRRRRYEPLFRDGLQVRGEIAAVQGTASHNVFV